MKVELTPTAKRDLAAVGGYLAEQSPGAAERLLRTLAAKANEIGQHPQAWPIVPKFEDLGIRRRIASGYLIFYRIEPTRIAIIHILHRARDAEALLLDDEDLGSGG